MGIFSMNKKGQEKNFLTTGILILLGIVLIGQIDFFDNLLGVTDGDGDEAPIGLAPDGICPIGAVIEDVTVTFDVSNKHAIGQAVTGVVGADLDEIFYRVNGGNIQPGVVSGDGVADRATVTFSPGDELTIYWAWDPTGDTHGQAYTVITEEIVPCKGTKTFEAEVLNQSTNPTWNLRNINGATVTGASAGDSLNVDDGDSDTCASGSIKAEKDNGISQSCMVVDFAKNNTALDDVTILFDGVAAESCPVPDAHNAAYGNTIGAPDVNTRQSKGFLMPSIEDSAELDFAVCLKDNNGATLAVEGVYVNMTIWDYDWVWSDLDNDIIFGPEDPDDDSDVGTDNSVHVTNGQFVDGFSIS